MIKEVMIASFVLLIYLVIVETIWLKQLITEKSMNTKNVSVEPKCDKPQSVCDNQQNDTDYEPLRFVIEIPKKAGKGEDAPPLLMDLNLSEEYPASTKSELLGVFDGMGGAGSESVLLEDGTQRTNAYVGSRTTRQLVERFFCTLKTTGGDIAQQLKTWIQYGLRKRSAELEANGVTTKPRLKSTMHKKLPTTMALSLYRYPEDDDKVHVTTLWAGDSRCFALSPQKGLLQLTKDDNGIEDPLLALSQAPPMHNSISASAEFKINRMDYEMELPLMLFVASDGMFDYFPSPILIEYFILETLQGSSDVVEWKNRLQGVFDIWKQDDVSMAMTLPGFKSFNEAKNVFGGRYEWLKSNYGDLIEKAKQCTRVLKREKELYAQIAEYNANKEGIDHTIGTIESELELLLRKMEELHKLIDGYRGRIVDKKFERASKESEKGPWDEKIAAARQSIQELKRGDLLDELWKEAVRTWEGYQASYKEMLNRQLNEEQSASGEAAPTETGEQDIYNTN